MFVWTCFFCSIPGPNLPCTVGCRTGSDGCAKGPGGSFPGPGRTLKGERLELEGWQWKVNLTSPILTHCRMVKQNLWMSCILMHLDASCQGYRYARDHSQHWKIWKLCERSLQFVVKLAEHDIASFTWNSIAALWVLYIWGQFAQHPIKRWC